MFHHLERLSLGFMKRLLIALALAGTANAALATPADTPILPGYWKWSVRAFAVVPADSGRQCIREDEIEKFLSFPGNKHYKCSYSTQRVANGRVEMVGACVDKRGRRAPIRTSGTYSPQQFRLNIALTTTNGIPIRGAMNAQRISARCPAGAPGA
jgi:hypothetical protein